MKYGRSRELHRIWQRLLHRGGMYERLFVLFIPIERFL